VKRKFSAHSFLANGQEFFVKAADLPSAIHEVNLKNPVTLLAFCVEIPHTVRIIGVNIQGDLIHAVPQTRGRWPVVKASLRPPFAARTPFAVASRKYAQPRSKQND
jgi:hypothetical protein